MEEFYIPNILTLVGQNKNEIVINIIGHSRGAITSFAMSNCIDNWMKKIKEITQNELKITATDIYKSQVVPSLDEDQIFSALHAIKSPNIKYKIRILGYDPVEGAVPVGDYYSSGFSLKFFNLKINVNYVELPSSVVEVKICLAESERRTWFQPSIPEFHENTIVSIKCVIGAHSTMNGCLSNNNNDGSDALCVGAPIDMENIFIREASRAAIDLRKIDDNRFLFKNKLPSFQYSTLSHVYYSNSGKGYVATKNRLLNLIQNFISQNKDDTTFKDFIFKLMDLKWSESNKLDDHIKNLDDGNFLDFLTSNQLIELTQWIMQKHHEMNWLLYNDLEKDVHEIYLSPKRSDHLKYLGDWQMRIKQDTNDIFKKYDRSAPKDDAGEERKLWCVSKRGKEQKSISEVYFSAEKNSLLNMWFPGFMPIGGKEIHTFIDNYYFDIKNMLEENEIEENYDAFLEIQLAFSYLNFHMISFYNRKTYEKEKSYKDALKNFIIPLNGINVTIGSKILAIFMMRINHIFNINIEEVKTDGNINNKLFQEAINFSVDYRLRTMNYLLRNNTFLNAPELLTESAKLISYLEKTHKSNFEPNQLDLFNQCKKICDENQNQIKLLDEKINNYFEATIEYKSSRILGENEAVKIFKEKMIEFKKELYGDIDLVNENLSAILDNLFMRIEDYVDKTINEIKVRFYGKSSFKTLLEQKRRIERLKVGAKLKNLAIDFSAVGMSEGVRELNSRINKKIDNYEENVVKKYTPGWSSKKNEAVDKFKNKLDSFKAELARVNLAGINAMPNLIRISNDVDICVSETIKSPIDQTRFKKSNFKKLLEKQQKIEKEEGRAPILIGVVQVSNNNNNIQPADFHDQVKRTTFPPPVQSPHTSSGELNRKTSLSFNNNNQFSS